MEEERQKNSEDQAKLWKCWKNGRSCGKMEEVKEEFEVKKNIFFHFPQNIGRMEEE